MITTAGTLLLQGLVLQDLVLQGLVLQLLVLKGLVLQGIHVVLQGCLSMAQGSGFGQ